MAEQRPGDQSDRKDEVDESYGYPEAPGHDDTEENGVRWYVVGCVPAIVKDLVETVNPCNEGRSG